MHINTTTTSRTRSNTSRSRNPYHTAVQTPDGLDSQNLNNAQLRTLVATILQPTLSPPFRAHLETGELDDVIDDIMSLCEVAAVAAHDGCEFPDDVVNESKAMAAVADHLASLVLARPFNLAYRKALRVAGAGKENSAPPAMVSSRRSAKNVSLVGLARDSSARSDRSATTAVAATAAAAAVTGSLAPPSCTLRGLPHIVKPRIKRDRPRDIDLDETSYYTCLEKFVTLMAVRRFDKASHPALHALIADLFHSHLYAARHHAIVEDGVARLRLDERPVAASRRIRLSAHTTTRALATKLPSSHDRMAALLAAQARLR